MSTEPSMEEILSSIKRIIDEEGPVRSRRTPRPAATPPVPNDEDDGDADDSVLELSDRIDPSPPIPVATTPLPSEPVTQAPAAPPPPPAMQRPILEMPSTESIVSDHAAEASRHAIEHLTRTLHATAPAPATPSAGPTADASLEGMVREMLRPMLRDWLDARLPAMVEEIVAKEIARITGGSR